METTKELKDKVVIYHEAIDAILALEPIRGSLTDDMRRTLQTLNIEVALLIDLVF